MVQIPSQDWPRRILPLTGAEDLLKQNPASDSAPQEERIPVDLITNYTLDQITLTSVGGGTSLIYGKFGNDLRFNSISPASSRISINLSSNLIEIDANAIVIANSVSLSDIGNVTSSPTVGEFLQYDGSGWITAPVLDQFYITDGPNTQVLNSSFDTISFVSTTNITAQVMPTNQVVFTWQAGIADLSDISVPSGANKVLVWDGSSYTWSDFTTLGGGTVTDAQNIGTLGQGVFASKLGSILRFRNVAPNSSKVLVTLSSNNILVDVAPLQIANEIRLENLLDVAGPPVHGDTLVYNDSTMKWETIPASGSGFSFDVYDQLNLFNSFGPVTPIRIYGQNGIETEFSSPTELAINLNAGLQNLSNVAISAVQNGDILVYNSVGGEWENKPLQFTVQGNVGSQLVKNGETLKILGNNGIFVQVISPDTTILNFNASLDDLSDIDTPTGINQILLWDGSAYVWTASSSISGEANTASNVGSAGFGVYKQKTGANLEFRNVASGSSKIDVTLNTNDITIDADAVQIASEVNLEQLANVVDVPDLDGFLKYNGTSWVTEVINGNFNVNIEADSGTNISLQDGDTYIIGGDDQFISTLNYVSGTTLETSILLDVNAVAQAIDLEDLGNVFGNPFPNDIIKYDGTKFIFEPLPTVSFSNAWLLDGNSEVSEKSFGTLTNFNIPIITNGNQVGVFRTNGRFGWGVTNPESTVEVNGSLGLGNMNTVTSSYIATGTDYMILADASSGAMTITIPAATGLYRREYVVKKIDSTGNSVIISSATNIDGALTYTILSQYVAIKLKSNGTQWFIY